jgi:tyrosinase
MVAKNLAVALTGALLAGLAVSKPTPRGIEAIPTFTAQEITSGKAIQQLGKIAYDNAMARVNAATSGCTKDKVKVRKEW